MSNSLEFASFTVGIISQTSSKNVFKQIHRWNKLITINEPNHMAITSEPRQDLV